MNKGYKALLNSSEVGDNVCNGFLFWRRIMVDVGFYFFDFLLCNVLHLRMQSFAGSIGLLTIYVIAMCS